MGPRIVTDQMGREVCIPQVPRTIISLVPSQTELLFDLGLEERIAGITKFCIHPQNRVKSIPKIGGTKRVLFDKIRSLKPDLIIGNKEENSRADILELSKEFPVWMSDIHNLDEALAMIRLSGEITGTADKAAGLAAEISGSFAQLPLTGRPLSVAYFIWKDPYMLAGTGTFINDMLHRAGFQNKVEIERYPVYSENDIRKLSPDLVFLSSEPYPFTEKHIDDIRQLCPESKVIIVDGEMFSWYGSRLRLSASYLGKLTRDVKYLL